MSEHFIKKCKLCGTIASQCRCPSPYKMVTQVVCSACLQLESDSMKKQGVGAPDHIPKDEVA